MSESLRLLEEILKIEGIHDWTIKFVEDSCEALTLFDTKTIIFGENGDMGLMLHEIAHIKTHTHHYDPKFINEYETLCKKHNWKSRTDLEGFPKRNEYRKINK